MNAELDILKRGWGYPDTAGAAALVERLRSAWERGHTAIVLQAPERALLKGCAAVGTGDQATPLVLKKDLLQSWRFHEAERQVAVRLKQMAGTEDRAPGTPLQKLLEELSPAWVGAEQAAAVALGQRKQLALITGGPGTGKTRTAAFLLALRLLEQPRLRYALAAPTNKAARRLGDSIAKVASGLTGALAPAKAGLEAASKHARTLHGLLAWNRETDRCGRNADRPLALDLLIVDEASMMDILQWRVLLDALPAKASLVVLGDPRQLESVEAGRVLGVMVESGQKGALKGCHAELNENFRFAGRPGIRALAEAARLGDLKALLAASPAPQSKAADQVEGLRNAKPSDALDRVWEPTVRLAAAKDPGEALQALQSLRVLCAVNRGPYGVEGMNAAIEDRLAVWALAKGIKDWCRPVIIKVNDPHTDLSNGDLGVLMPRAQGGQAWFDRGGAPKAYALSRLPERDLAWAMSVHKSQGSEYKAVLVVLPPAEELNENTRALLTPELLYTAVTRAEERVVLCAEEPALALACEAREPRVTGLGEWMDV